MARCLSLLHWLVPQLNCRWKEKLAGLCLLMPLLDHHIMYLQRNDCLCLQKWETAVQKHFITIYFLLVFITDGSQQKCITFLWWKPITLIWRLKTTVDDSKAVNRIIVFGYHFNDTASAVAFACDEVCN